MTHISISENGPLIVKEATHIQGTDGKELEKKPVIALCRCGASKNKPYCDGAHVAAGFSGKKERTQNYETKEFSKDELSVLDNEGICCHDGACDRDKAVFFERKGDERICAVEKGETEHIKDTIKLCPSGALAYKENGVVKDTFSEQEQIVIKKDGPIQIKGSIVLDDETASKELISKEHYTLCRCGHSKNKPFCDGAHIAAGFKD